jgi:hypothetical protein
MVRGLLPKGAGPGICRRYPAPFGISRLANAGVSVTAFAMTQGGLRVRHERARDHGCCAPSPAGRQRRPDERAKMVA